MDNQPLSAIIRFKATLCHLIGLLWLPSLIPILRILSQSFASNPYTYLPIIILPTIGIILTTLLTILVWQVNQRAHNFIDLSGRCATNFMCSCSLYSLLISTVVNITCGISRVEIVGILTMLTFPLLFLLHFWFTILGATYAHQGKIYSYPLTIKFIPEQV
jgi:uncharacterized Tic20 family protein